MAVKPITDTDFEKEISNGTVLVDFWAEWCGPCKALSPILEELSGEMDDINFTSLDIDTNQQTPQKFGITAVPTLLLFRDGEIIARLQGALPKVQLKNTLQKHL